MRSLERIKRIMDKLQTLWEQTPDQRFNQLIVNLAFTGEDLFNLEDEIFEKRVDEALKTWPR